MNKMNIKYIEKGSVSFLGHVGDYEGGDVSLSFLVGLIGYHF